MENPVYVNLTAGDYYMALQAGSRLLYELILKDRKPKDSTQQDQRWLISNVVTGYMAEIAVAKYLSAYINQFQFYGEDSINVACKGVDVKSVCQREGEEPRMVVDLSKGAKHHPYVLVSFAPNNLRRMKIEGWAFPNELKGGFYPPRGGERHTLLASELRHISHINAMWFTTEDYLKQRKEWRHETGIEE